MFLRNSFFLCMIAASGFCFSQQPALMLPIGHTGIVKSASFSADGKKVLSVSDDGTAKLWETATGKLIYDFRPGGDASIVMVTQADFSPDGKKVIINYENSYSKVFDTNTGEFLWGTEYGGLSNGWEISTSHILNQISPDGKKIILFGDEQGAVIYNWDTRDTVKILKEAGKTVLLAAYSHDGKKIVTIAENRGSDSSGFVTGTEAGHTLILWDESTGKKIWTRRLEIEERESVCFSPDNKRILLVNKNNMAIMLDAANGKKMAVFPGSESGGGDHQFSDDSKKIIHLNDQFISGWDVLTGKQLWKASRDTFNLIAFSISPDSKQVVMTETAFDESWDNTKGAQIFIKNNKVLVRDMLTGKIQFVLKGHTDIINKARFNPDGKKIFTASADNSIGVWDAITGKLQTILRGHSAAVTNIDFSADGKKLASTSADFTVRIWDAETLNQTGSLTGHSNNFEYARFSADGKQIIIVSKNETRALDIETGRITETVPETDSSTSKLPWKEVLKYSPDSTYTVYWAVNYLNLSKVDRATGIDISSIPTVNLTEKELVSTVYFSPDSKKIIITYKNSRVKVYDIEQEKYLMTFIAVDSSDYLIADVENHYDGSESARKLLYFTCGTEIIELDQVKDQLWVPGLAQRILTGDSINAKTLAELNICGLTPQVEEISSNDGGYHFKIKPRRGGLGETIVFVNGIEARRYRPDQLVSSSGNYKLVIDKAALNDFFIPGRDNPIAVKAYTADNTVASRGAVMQANSTNETAAAPNLFAVIIGVSDYKGETLDLKYAAKDAADISQVINNAAKKLLNTDGKQHVFMYNLTTEKDRYLLPEKNSIIKVLQEIGKKAAANDILLFFFAGHGLMSGESGKKQFYFLTADASSLSSAEVLKNVGISTDELTEWIKPQAIRAQKRILIFDACNSGQAINDFVKLGNNDQQFIAARNDDKTQQIKAIDKLNEKSGLFILSASASNQSAYEMGRYSQGLLTYSLLKAIKQQPGILEDGKYLNISRWFNAAEKTVTEIAKETGARQEPQIVTNTNFNIGLVDDEVITKIILPEEKALFAGCNFQNADENIAADNLGLNKLTNVQLSTIASNSSKAPLSFVADSNAPDAFTLSGRYTVNGTDVSIKVLIRQENEVKEKLDLTGTTGKLNELATLISEKVAAWVIEKK